MQDVKNKLEKIHTFEVGVDISRLSQGEQSALKKCVEACQIIHKIFFDQVDSKSEERKKYVSTQSEDLQLYYEINGGPWDNFDDNKPFLTGVGERPLGSGFYPFDLTKEEWEDYLQKYPEKRLSFESPHTIIERDKNGGLISIPYHEKWFDELSKASQLLKEASKEVTGNFSEYLFSRAEALLNDDYQESDIKWLQMSDCPFEFTIGPIEVYEDKLFGHKTSYKGFVGVSNEKATKNLEYFEKYIEDFDFCVSKEVGNFFRKKKKVMFVTDDVFRAGSGIAGHCFVAFNLPNDKDIHEKYGSKSIFSVTLMKKKFDLLALPTAEQILSPSDVKNLNFHSRLLFVLGHEVAHGLGPSFVEKNGIKSSIAGELKDLHSSIEECKADCLGVTFLSFLEEKGVISSDEIKNAVLSQIINFFTKWKMNFSEAHSTRGLIEYNWLKNDGIISYDDEKNIFSIKDLEKMIISYRKLSFELMRLQKEGDYQNAKIFCDKWTTKPVEVLKTIDFFKEIPLGVYPIFNFPQ